MAVSMAAMLDDLMLVMLLVLQLRFMLHFVRSKLTVLLSLVGYLRLLLMTKVLLVGPFPPV